MGVGYLLLRRCCLRLFCALKDRSQRALGISGAALAALAVLLLAPQPARAVVHSSIVIDAQTGSVIEARNANALAHPASLTKLMTLYITFEQLQSGKLRLNERLRVSRHAASMQPTKLWLRPGSRVSVRSAILGITTRSANDAAVVLAEAIGGTESHFAQRMNRTARELGMDRTTFYNASGLPNRRQWTTAHDMAMLARALIYQYPQYYHFFSARKFVFRGHTIYGHDHVLDEFAGADGMKTGYTRSSGFNLVTSAIRNRRRLVAVVMGGRTARSRDRLMISLLRRGFANWRRSTLAANRVSHSQARRHATASLEFVRKVSENEDAERRASHSCVIQIGSEFRSARRVRSVLHSAVRSAPDLLSRNRELVVRLRGGHYRARFWHLSSETALRACRALRERKFTCTIIRSAAFDRDLAHVVAPEKSRAD